MRQAENHLIRWGKDVWWVTAGATKEQLYGNQFHNECWTDQETIHSTETCGWRKLSVLQGNEKTFLALVSQPWQGGLVFSSHPELSLTSLYLLCCDPGGRFFQSHQRSELVVAVLRTSLLLSSWFTPVFFSSVVLYILSLCPLFYGLPHYTFVVLFVFYGERHSSHNAGRFACRWLVWAGFLGSVVFDAGQWC